MEEWADAQVVGEKERHAHSRIWKLKRVTRRRVSWCREKAKGATFFEAREGETARPMLDVCWAPMLGAFSVLFEEFSEGDNSRATTGHVV